MGIQTGPALRRVMLATKDFIVYTCGCQLCGEDTLLRCPKHQLKFEVWLLLRSNQHLHSQTSEPSQDHKQPA